MNVVIENGKAFASPKGWRDKESGFAGFCRAGGNVVKPGFPAKNLLLGSTIVTSC